MSLLINLKFMGAGDLIQTYLQCQTIISCSDRCCCPIWLCLKGKLLHHAFKIPEGGKAFYNRFSKQTTAVGQLHQRWASTSFKRQMFGNNIVNSAIGKPTTSLNSEHQTHARHLTQSSITFLVAISQFDAMYLSPRADGCIELS